MGPSAYIAARRQGAAPSHLCPRITINPTAGGVAYHPHRLARLRRNMALGDNMKGFHAGALTCLGIALLFYVLSWTPGAIGLAAIGFIFEVAAWVQVFTACREQPREP